MIKSKSDNFFVLIFALRHSIYSRNYLEFAKYKDGKLLTAYMFA